VVLEEQGGLGFLAEAHKAAVLGLLDEGAELGAAELVFEELDAVEPVLDVVAADEESGTGPGGEGICGRG
jgi:hypothetical protein